MDEATNRSTADTCHHCYVLVIFTKFIEIVSPGNVKANIALEFDAIETLNIIETQ